MKKDYTWIKMMAGYILILLLMIISSTANGQSPCGNDELCVVQFNAGFNAANKVEWIGQLNEVETTFIDIGVDTKAAGKYKIVVIPTILIFNGSTLCMLSIKGLNEKRVLWIITTSLLQ